jgi:hypothetical protein
MSDYFECTSVDGRSPSIKIKYLQIYKQLQQVGVTMVYYTSVCDQLNLGDLVRLRSTFVDMAFPCMMRDLQHYHVV